MGDSMADLSLQCIENNLRSKIQNRLNGVGLLYRLFSRVKSIDSISEKTIRKNISSNHMIEDLFALRLVAYFQEDLDLMVKLCESIFGKGVPSKDPFDKETFKAKKFNMVFDLPKEDCEDFKLLKEESETYKFVDGKFEIQFRTVLSEGWLEVEHLMRYKCSKEWTDLDVESRMMNGIYATLETCDMTMSNLFEKMAYHHYKNENWQAMFRNKLMLDFGQNDLSDNVSQLFSSDKNLAKLFFKTKRADILNKYVDLDIRFPPKIFNNWIYFINYFFVKNEKINSMIPESMKEKFINADKNAEVM